MRSNVFFRFVIYCSAFIALMTTCVVFAAQEPSPQMTKDMPKARLQVLDKTTARTLAFTVDVGKPVQIGPLFIRMIACRVPTEMTDKESTVFLQIWEEKPPEFRPAWVFSGWMFASSPAVSAMDHPIYDVWVVECTDKDS